MFSAKYEDVTSGRVWQGVIKYVIGALLDIPDAPPDYKLLVIEYNYSSCLTFIIEIGRDSSNYIGLC